MFYQSERLGSVLFCVLRLQSSGCILTGSRDGCVAAWSGAEAGGTRLWQAHAADVSAIAGARGGIVTASVDGSAALWRWPQAQAVAEAIADGEGAAVPMLARRASHGLASCVRVDADAGAVFMAHADGTVSCWPFEDA